MFQGATGIGSTFCQLLDIFWEAGEEGGSNTFISMMLIIRIYNNIAYFVIKNVYKMLNYQNIIFKFPLKQSLTSHHPSPQLVKQKNNLSMF